MFTILGLLTFFVPLIRADPPVGGKGHWSPLDVALYLPLGINLETPFLLLQIPFALVYLLLLLAIAALCFFPSRAGLIGISGYGIYLLFPFRGFFGGIRLASIATSGGGVDAKPLWLFLFLIMLLVAAAAWTDTEY